MDFKDQVRSTAEERAETRTRILWAFCEDLRLTRRKCGPKSSLTVAAGERVLLVFNILSAMENIDLVRSKKNTRGGGVVRRIGPIRHLVPGDTEQEGKRTKWPEPSSDIDGSEFHEDVDVLGSTHNRDSGTACSLPDRERLANTTEAPPPPTTGPKYLGALGHMYDEEENVASESSPLGKARRPLESRKVGKVRLILPGQTRVKVNVGGMGGYDHKYFALRDNRDSKIEGFLHASQLSIGLKTLPQRECPPGAFAEIMVEGWANLMTNRTPRKCHRGVFALWQARATECNYIETRPIPVSANVTEVYSRSGRPMQQKATTYCDQKVLIPLEDQAR
ncbi:hypothetical protein M407DRAFT_12808 [Tulasnella calospora MUT 4182]|uniref:Uncharacterized protein n=1 Tax=Tulasnella calospora MUT 4182 TaxID=1051891 RepID=A0A0C3Q1K8_9AGAM|nr:hypothetical protein M407DRAFT_12808 [Tulasnella calospora MUT 4182]